MRCRRPTEQCVWLGPGRYSRRRRRRNAHSDPKPNSDSNGNPNSDGDSDSDAYGKSHRNSIGDDNTASDANAQIRAIGQTAPYSRAKAVAGRATYWPMMDRLLRKTMTGGPPKAQI